MSIGDPFFARYALGGRTSTEFSMGSCIYDVYIEDYDTMTLSSRDTPLDEAIPKSIMGFLFVNDPRDTGGRGQMSACVQAAVQDGIEKNDEENRRESKS